MPVVAAALTDANGRVLMQRRAAGKQHGGLWEFPGGKIEPGETLAAALVRELSEELGLTVAVEDVSPITFAADARTILLLFRCTRWRGTPAALEAAALRWDTPERLLALAMPPLDVPLCQALAMQTCKK